MKHFLLFSLLALMLSAFAAKPALAIQPNKGRAFSFGFITGIIPVVGQAIAIAGSMEKNNPKLAISFIAGHVLGTSIWALPLYLVYKNYSSKA